MQYDVHAKTEVLFTNEITRQKKSVFEMMPYVTVCPSIVNQSKKLSMSFKRIHYV